MIIDKPKIELDQSSKYQYLAAFIVSLLTIGFGTFEGWTSPSIILLLSDESPLPTGKISMEEASWVASLQCVGGIAGNFFFGYMINHYGRKISIMITVIPTIGNWLLTWFAPNVYYIYVARLIGGFTGGGGGYMIVPIFLSEIASDSVRGTLTSTLVLAENVGMLLAFAIGNYFDFYAIPKFCIVLMTVFAILFYFLPESPLFLLRQNKVTQAENSLRFYRNVQDNEKDRNLLEAEMNKLRAALTNVQSDGHSTVKWSDFTTTVARKAILIGVVLMVMNQFCGIPAILSYAANIFQSAGSNMTPNMSALFVGIIQVIGNCIATHLVDRAGRKLLLGVSNIGTALGLIVMGVYMMLKSSGYDVSAFSWIPVGILSAVILIASFGIMPLPYILMPETMPENIKGVGVSFCMSLLWIFNFITIKYLPLLMDVVGFHGSMYLFAGVCVFAAIYFILFVPETKDRSYEEIMRSLE